MKNTENKTACYIYLTTQGVLSGKNLFSSSFILKIAYNYIVLSILSRWVITTISGNLNMLASYKVSGFMAVVLTPDTTHNAYSGKNEHRDVTSCFFAFLWPPTSMKVSNLFALSSHL